MSSKPNILVFMTDDHGQWASNCYGTSVIQSPSMDRLAETGARMTRAFTSCPVCSPARASFFTGTIPSRHGINDYIQGDVLPAGHRGIHDQTNIGQILQGAGYQTAMIGKWHCGEAWLPERGFDRWFSHFSSQRPHFGPIAFSDQGRRVDYTGYQTLAISEQAVRFVRERRTDQPFFMFVGYVDTHTPYSEHPPRLVDIYRRRDLSCVPNEPFAACHGVPITTMPDDPAERQEALAQYFAAVTFIDEQIGRLMDELQSAGVLDETLIVYTSDHGHMNGHHGTHCKGNATTPQNFLEESILVPSLLSWPGHIAPRRMHDVPVDHCDLFATLLDAGGATIPHDIQSPGQSFLTILRGEPAAWRSMQFIEYGNARCARTERLKLIRRYAGPNGRFPDELYDLVLDPRETLNRFGDPSYAADIKVMTDAMDAYFTRHSDPAFDLSMASQPPLNPYHPWRR